MDSPAPQQAPDHATRRRNRLSVLLKQAELEGVRLQFWVTTIAILGVALLFAALVTWDKPLLYLLATLCVFLLANLLNYVLAIRGKRPRWLGYTLGIAMMVFLTVVIILPNPFGKTVLPLAMGLREAGFKYLIILICLSALTLSPRFAVVVGLAATLSWSAAVAFVVYSPGTLTARGPSDAIPIGEKLRLYFNPYFVDIFDQITNIAVLVIITGIIAAVVARARGLAEDYTRAERARMNLARHFSPNVVDELASNDDPFGPVRRQEVAVLFADIVGFTNYSEDHAAEDVFDMLREFHRRMEQVVFDHGGTVDNYIGDCIMATFGVPRSKPDDASRALRCAVAMRASVKEWNRFRQRTGADPVDVRFGCQYGPVVVGAIGSERNLSVAVVGDPCNVASRLQTMCRELDADICAGSALLSRADPVADADFLRLFVEIGPVAVRGRDSLVDAWIVPRPQAS